MQATRNPHNKGNLIWAGGLPDMGKREIEAMFAEFGTILDVWVSKTRPGYAFVEFKKR